MTFGTAALLLLLAVAGIIISCLCLRQKKALRAVCITVCALAALALTVLGLLLASRSFKRLKELHL